MKFRYNLSTGMLWHKIACCSFLSWIFFIRW